MKNISPFVDENCKKVNVKCVGNNTAGVENAENVLYFSNIYIFLVKSESLILELYQRVTVYKSNILKKMLLKNYIFN